MAGRVGVMGILLVVCVLAGGVIGYGVGRSVAPAESGFSPDDQVSGVRTAAGQAGVERDSVNAAIAGSRESAITHAVSVATPAVVGINVIELRQYRRWSPWGDDPFFRNFFGDDVVTQQVQDLGSGFLISPDGYILTNDHVAGNAKEITVTMTGGHTYKAELVGSDQVTDVALLKIDGKDLPYLRLGNSDNIIIGEWAIALGNPFGLFERNNKPTVTVGVVSSTDMNLRAQEGRSYRGMIQTDAAINAGNSGGPLINSVGEVIGMNAVIYTMNQGNIGIGFAIPINKVKTIVAELKRSGKVEREFWTGLEIQPVDRRIARYFGLTRVEGVIISDVKNGSPADKAGLKVGDIILEANGEKIVDESSLVGVVDDARTGDVVKLKIFRDRDEMTVNLRLERRR